jgi:hypothetical protein
VLDFLTSEVLDFFLAKHILQNKKILLTQYRQQKNIMRDLQTVLANTKAIIKDNSQDKSGKLVYR